MKNLLRVFLFTLALAGGLVAAGADTAQVIHVDILSAEKMVVEGKPVAAAVLTATVSGLVVDKEHVAVELRIPAGLSKPDVEKIMNACRRAGIARFSIVNKP